MQPGGSKHIRLPECGEETTQAVGRAGMPGRLVDKVLT